MAAAGKTRRRGSAQLLQEGRGQFFCGWCALPGEIADKRVPFSERDAAAHRKEGAVEQADAVALRGGIAFSAGRALLLGDREQIAPFSWSGSLLPTGEKVHWGRQMEGLSGHTDSGFCGGAGRTLKSPRRLLEKRGRDPFSPGERRPLEVADRQ